MEQQRDTPGMIRMATEGEDTPAAAQRRQAFVGSVMEMHQAGKLMPAIDHWNAVQASKEATPEIARHLRRVTVALNNCGLMLYKESRFEDALECFLLALRAEKKCAPALNNAAACLRDLGRLADSTAVYRQALELNPNPAVHSNLIFNLHYDPTTTPQTLLQAHREWDVRHGSGVLKPMPAYLNEPSPERCLRVGLVSADLGNHPVGLLLIKYLENIDPKEVAFICYATSRRESAVTDRFRKASLLWHEVAHMSNEAVARQIVADQIDILIDLNGHTAENRLPLFVYKPAPVQMTWIGNPGETGIDAMDCVIGDPYVLPESIEPYLHAKVLRLPHSFICFEPPSDAPEPSPLPATVAGAVTLACFNNPVKVNAEVVALWAAILQRLPASTLLFKYKGFGAPRTMRRFIEQFATHGVDPTQLIFEDNSPLHEMYEVMKKVDFALDPFPFGGGMMSLYTMWMSIPIVTMPVELFAGRQTLGFFSAIGILDTIAKDRAGYIEKAVALAHNLPQLADLRRRIRPAMAASPLCDGPKAAGELQKLLRDAWRAWCAKKNKTP